MSMINAHDLEGKTVAFVNFATGTAIDLKDGFTNPPDGTLCIGWQAHLNENQQWKCVKYHQFRLQNVRASGRAMDLYNGGTSDGTEIVGWIENIPNGTWVTLQGGSAQYGTRIVGSHGSLNDLRTDQLWILKLI
ncbi:hypothetical protein LB504_002050 [Fusarium proliferatum]|nr:hypothetical protein LB504_002050 [Fusarium proliferatum]